MPASRKTKAKSKAKKRPGGFPTAPDASTKRLTTGGRTREQLQRLVDFPGMSLKRLYRGVVMEAQEVHVSAHAGPKQKDEEELDSILMENVRTLHKTGNALATSALILKIKRARNSAEDIRVRWNTNEITIGAAAMQVEGVNKLLELRQAIKAEKKTGRTIDNMPDLPPPPS
jgi:hypothetical protein